MTHMKEWLERTAEEDERLYLQYGKPLEKSHKGEYVAIARDGQTILSTDPDEVLRKAVSQFDSGSFALARVGEKGFDKLTPTSQTSSESGTASSPARWGRRAGTPPPLSWLR
jgi:hypothetical protein